MVKKVVRHRKGISRPQIGKSYAIRGQKKRLKEAGVGNGKPKTSSKSNGTEDINHLKTYESHGVSFFRKDDKEHKATCPFCDKKSFSVNEVEGLFRCWDCGKQGNKYNFLQFLYEEHLERTTTAHYKALSKNRKIPVEAFQTAELAYDRDGKRWLIPVRNAQGSMVNLRHWKPDQKTPDGKKPWIMNTGGCKTHLYNLERVEPTNSTIYVTEGEWDCIALEWLLLQNKVKDCSVVAVPGADTFKEEWVKVFAGKHVILLYDNDEAGQRGVEKTSGILRQHTLCASISAIKWPTSFPEKFDIRDYVIKNKLRPKRGLGELRKMLEPLALHDKTSSGVIRETFNDVVKDFKKHIYMSKDAEDALLLIFSVIFSNHIFPDPYCPLWLFLVAPPGGGKTMLLQSTGDTDYVAFQSTLTPKTLVSGFKTSDGSDLSLLPKIIGKTLIIKDFTGIMSLSSGDQDEIYGVLRDAYDGRVEKPFGHIGTRVYPDPAGPHKTCHFTMIAGVTGAVHADRRANHGERFLKYQMLPPSGRDAINQLRSAIRNTIESTNPETLLRPYASAFIEYKLSQPAIAPAGVPTWVEDRIIGLGQIVSTVRAVVLRKQGELVVRPESEVASRISKELIKLGQSIAFALGKTAIDEECYRLMQRVGLDTCYGWHRDVIMTVAQSPKGITLNETCLRAQISRTTTRRCLEDLFELGAITFILEGEGTPRLKKGAGQPAQRWLISPFMQDLFKRAAIDSHTLRILSREVAAKKGDSSLPGKSIRRKMGKPSVNGKPQKTAKKKARPRRGGRLVQRAIGKARKKS